LDRRALVELKIEMEFGVAPIGYTLSPPATNDDGYPRLLVSRFDGRHARYLRHDLTRDIRVRLDAFDPEELMRDEALAREILAPCETIYRIRWLTFERMPDRSECPDVVVQDGRHVVVVDGTVVAWAFADRETARAAEVSIETLPAFRGRGYARQVAASWGAATLAAGKVAYYSHLAANTASAGVAASLGLRRLSDEIEFM
jgi:hypothetical protein